MNTTYQVYVLENLEGRFYIGLSEDIQTRLKQHNEGLSKWTSKYRPWTIVWNSVPMPLTDARKLENQLKRHKGGDGFYAQTGLLRKRQLSGS